MARRPVALLSRSRHGQSRVQHPSTGARRRTECTDNAPRATERLRDLFAEAEVVVHDLATQAPPPADLHLMHRIDTELDTVTWKQVFARFSEPILVVPTLLLDASACSRS